MQNTHKLRRTVCRARPMPSVARWSQHRGTRHTSVPAWGPPPCSRARSERMHASRRKPVGPDMARGHRGTMVAMWPYRRPVDSGWELRCRRAPSREDACVSMLAGCAQSASNGFWQAESRIRLAAGAPQALCSGCRSLLSRARQAKPGDCVLSVMPRRRLVSGISNVLQDC